jgi:hypothetical protein
MRLIHPLTNQMHTEEKQSNLNLYPDKKASPKTTNGQSVLMSSSSSLDTNYDNFLT